MLKTLLSQLYFRFESPSISYQMPIVVIINVCLLSFDDDHQWHASLTSGFFFSLVRNKTKHCAIPTNDTFTIPPSLLRLALAHFSHRHNIHTVVLRNNINLRWPGEFDSCGKKKLLTIIGFWITMTYLGGGGWRGILYGTRRWLVHLHSRTSH